MLGLVAELGWQPKYRLLASWLRCTPLALFQGSYLLLAAPSLAFPARVRVAMVFLDCLSQLVEVGYVREQEALQARRYEPYLHSFVQIYRSIKLQSNVVLIFGGLSSPTPNRIQRMQRYVVQWYSIAPKHGAMF